MKKKVRMNMSKVDLIGGIRVLVTEHPQKQVAIGFHGLDLKQLECLQMNLYNRYNSVKLQQDSNSFGYVNHSGYFICSNS